MFLLAFLVDPAHACSIVVGAPHEVVENPADVTPPSAPAAPTFTVGRGDGPQCTGPICSYTSCDDIGSINLDVDASTDDVSPPEAIGYRVRAVEGTLPDGLTVDQTRHADHIADGRADISLIWGDDAEDEQEPFDFVLGITAVDEAGNESEELLVDVSDPGRAAAACATVRPEGGLALALVLLATGARRRRT